MFFDVFIAMKKDMAIEYILKTVGITDGQVDLIRKIISLNDNDIRVSSVDLRCKYFGCGGFSAIVSLRDNFEGIDDFRQYLVARGLPKEEISINKKECIYVLQNEGIITQFYVPRLFRPISCVGSGLDC